MCTYMPVSAQIINLEQLAQVINPSATTPLLPVGHVVPPLSACLSACEFACVAKQI